MGNYSRSAERYKKQGVMCGKVELPANPRTKERSDLFGVFDMIALDSDIVGVQICGDSQKTDHIKKLTVDEAESTREWLGCGGTVELQVWGKRKMFRGSKRMVWKCRVFDILLINNELYWEERE